MEKGKETKSSVDEQTQEYFKRVNDVIDEDDFDDDEQRKLFVANVFTQVEKNELSLACDQSLSIVMEKLVVHFSEVQIRAMLQSLQPDFGVISTDKCGSHVLQSLINCVPRGVRSERKRTRKVGDEDLESTTESLFLQFCGFVKENLTDLVCDIYGSHVVRTVLEVLSGVKVADSIARSRSSRARRDRSSGGSVKDQFHKLCPVGSAFGSSTAKPVDTLATPESFHPILRKIAKKLLKSDLEKLTIHSIGSPVLQTLLLVLHKRDTRLCYKVCKAIMEQCNLYKQQKNNTHKQEDSSSSASYKVPPLFAHESGSHVVEKILHVVSPELHLELYSTFFKSHLPQLVEHPIANYIVQHLLASCTDKTQAESIVVELLDLMEDILALGHIGIIIRIVELCARHHVQQESVTHAVLSAFHCAGEEESHSAAALITSLTTYDVFFGKPSEASDKAADTQLSTVEPRLKSVNYHGAMMIKSLFEFDKPEVFADSLVSALSCVELLFLSGDVLGSFVVEAFLKSHTVGVKKKHKFIKKLKGNFTKLACEKHGSHVVDTCWRQADAKYKERITAELAESEAQLNNNFYGRIVLKNCGTEQYKKNNPVWLEKQDKAARKRKMFEEILGGEGAVTSTKETRDVSQNKDESRAVSHEQLSKYSSEMEALGFGEDDDKGSGTEEATEKMEQGDRLDSEHNELFSTDNQQVKDRHRKRKKPQKTQSKQDDCDDVNFIVSAIEATKTKKKQKRKEKSAHEC